MISGVSTYITSVYYPLPDLPDDIKDIQSHWEELKNVVLPFSLHIVKCFHNLISFEKDYKGQNINPSLTPMMIQIITISKFNKYYSGIF